METFLNITGQIFTGFFRIIGSILSGMVSIISDYPKFSAGVVAITGFMYCLRYVPGFGDMAVQIITLVLILAAFGLFKKKS